MSSARGWHTKASYIQPVIAYFLSPTDYTVFPFKPASGEAVTRQKTANYFYLWTPASSAHSESRGLFQKSRTMTFRLDIPASAAGHRCVSFKGHHIANTSPWDSVNESSVPVLFGGRSLQDTWETKLTYVSAVLREPGRLNEPAPTGLQGT